MTLRSALFAIALLPSLTTAQESAKPRLNVLFIAVDDLRPELGCYGYPTVRSPHLDRIAREGTLFERAYCQQAVCNPSRASIMTGRRPESLEVTDLPTHFRDKSPDVVTVAQHFKEHGYYTERIGKIYHTAHGNRDDVQSWSTTRKHVLAPRRAPKGLELQKRLRSSWRRDGKKGSEPRGRPAEGPDVADDKLLDGSVAAGAIAILEEVADRPFFLAVGFHNPHLPFVAPKKYYDLYDPAAIELADNPYPPEGAPAYALSRWGELRRYHGIPARGPLTDIQARRLIHGYHAATSYIDAQIGRLLAALERLKLRDETIVVVWGDHGWQLGEHGMWCKHTNYEVAARVPLLISVPGQAQPGAKTRALTELVDVYPSLVELCELPMPVGLEGTSFAPLLADPDRPWKTAAFNLYPRRIPNHGRGMGRSIRTDRYRLVEWSASGDDFVEYELYDHQVDPDENVNLAGHADRAGLVSELAARLHAGWRAALPPIGGEVRVEPVRVPVLINRPHNPIAKLSFTEAAATDELVIRTGGHVRRLFLAPTDSRGRPNLEKVIELRELPRSVVQPLAMVSSSHSAPLTDRIFECAETTAEHLWLLVELADETPLSTRVVAEVRSVAGGGTPLRVVAREGIAGGHRVGLRLRHRGDDGSDGYRIPGLVRTNSGTLLATYDIRYPGNRDLQGNLDIGLSRSTDGGQSWEPMRTVLDMGTYGGLPQKYNGVSDAGILVDRGTGRVFVFGCWMHGLRDDNGAFRADLTPESTDWNHQWRKGPGGSGPGLSPKETCQFVMAYSDDDGQTWSRPINITKQVKDPDWYLAAPAPGDGITMTDGTLVLPAGGRDARQRTFSTIMYSRDHGKSWAFGSPARLDTTESTVVELGDGSLMLNMRDNRNRRDKSATNGRAVAITTDLGASWRVHPSDHRADLLQEPVCMASLIRIGDTLLFSNPNDKGARRHMTIKASTDGGLTWPKKHQIELDALGGAYSCLAPVDGETVGILYESSQGYLVFQRVPMADFGLGR